MIGEGVERADLRERAQLIFVQRDAELEIVHGGEGALAALREQGLRIRFAQTLHHAEAQAHGVVGFDGAVPIGALHAHRADDDAVAFGVFHNRRRGIETHRLVVEEAGVKFRRVMHLHVGAAVSDDREADRVRLGEAVERER